MSSNDFKNIGREYLNDKNYVLDLFTGIRVRL